MRWRQRRAGWTFTPQEIQRDDDLNDVYDKNDEYCWHCGKKLAFVNYGHIGAMGAWEVDHSNPGGVDDLRNWVPACIPCNRSKQNLSTRQFSG